MIRYPKRQTFSSQHRHMGKKIKRSYAVQKASSGSGPWAGQKWQYSQSVFLLISIFEKKNKYMVIMPMQPLTQITKLMAPALGVRTPRVWPTWQRSEHV